MFTVFATFNLITYIYINLNNAKGNIYPQSRLNIKRTLENNVTNERAEESEHNNNKENQIIHCR